MNSAMGKVCATGTGTCCPVWQDLGLLALRVVLGTYMAIHGYGKLTGFDGTAAFMEGLMGLPGNVNASLAIFAEFFCSLALIAGLFTRLAALPLVITMCVAAFVWHSKDPWVSSSAVRQVGNDWLTGPNKESALIYAAGFAALMCLGAGRISLDHFICKLWPCKKKDAAK